MFHWVWHVAVLDFVHDVPLGQGHKEPLQRCACVRSVHVFVMCMCARACARGVGA